MRVYLRVAIGIVTTILVLLIIHFYMVSDLPGARMVQAAYQHRYLSRRNWPWFDIICPMLVLVLLTSKSLYKLHYLHSIIAVIVELTILIGLLAVYATFVSPSICYWWPHDENEIAPFLFNQFFRYLLFFGIAVLVMRLGIRNKERVV